jgi:hypothetical protein
MRVASPGVLRSHPDDHLPLGDEERELSIVEARHMHAGVAGEPELPSAIVDLARPSPTPTGCRRR